MQSLATCLRGAAKGCLLPLAQRAARAYIAGPELSDAMRMAQRLAGRGFRATLGYWDGEGDSPRAVADFYLAALDAMALAAPEAYLSIKLPALGSSRDLLSEVLDRARELQIPIHFDSLGSETADETWSTMIAAADATLNLSCSVPGRWRRSLDDVELAILHGIAIRVVKGQWPDPDEPHMDMRQGFLNVVDRLAGRACRVAVATHDAELAAESLRRLQAAGTPCELELLYGLPERAALRAAAAQQTPVRFYVPYGKAYLPYCLGQLKKQPGLIWRLLRDSLVSVAAPAGRPFCPPPVAPAASVAAGGTPAMRRQEAHLCDTTAESPTNFVP